MSGASHGGGVPQALPAKAFLASPTAMRDGREPHPVRALALRETGSDRRKLFVAESAWQEFDNSGVPALEIASALMGQLRQSDCLIFLLIGNKPGARMREALWTAHSTFFELEIFQSILLDKPVYLLVHNTFDASALGPYKDLLDFAFPQWRSHLNQPLNDLQTVEAIKRIVSGRPQEAWRVRQSTARSTHFHGGLFTGRDRFLRQQTVPLAHFMDLPSHRISVPGRIDMDLVARIVASRKSFEQEQDNDRRLAYSWILMRELLAEPLLDTAGELVQRDPLILSAWNTALGDWHGASSWNGLHSHIYLGTIATLGTIETVRKGSPAASGSGLDGQPTHFPGGAYASSYYSLSRRVPARLRNEALDIARTTLRMEENLFPGLYLPGMEALKASIALESGHGSEAIEIFERIVRFHKDQKSSPRDLGQVLCELAFARMLSGDRRRAAAEAEEGVQLMQQPGPDGSIVVDGFLVRAMFKTAAAQVFAAQPVKAMQLYGEALRHAKDKNLHDQYEQWRPRSLAKHALRKARNLATNYLAKEKV